jgi:hypothetical protein
MDSNRNHTETGVRATTRSATQSDFAHLRRVALLFWGFSWLPHVIFLRFENVEIEDMNAKSE